jgi:dipeptidyl aminopeptidase/acylaminoacyl peptidase
MAIPTRFSSTPWLLLLAGACSGGGGGSSPIGADAPPELLVCRARVDSPHSFAEVALRTAQNLGTRRIADRSGRERHARLHPDGNTVVFARERTSGDPASRELFTSTIDGTRAELRLTQDSTFDDEPCWSPSGHAILFASERAGARSLWLCDPDGANPRQFLTPPGGSTDGEPDWCRSTDRIVWSRRDGSGRHTLWLVQGDGTGVVQLTDGGVATGIGAGDRHPAFAPDGSRVAFARRLTADVAGLCLVDLATGTVTIRSTPSGQADLPRWSPAGDRLFFGLAEPTLGRATLRLASIPVAAGDPVLVWPDERWQLEGVEVMPSLGSAPAQASPVPLDVQEAEVQVAAGLVLAGSRARLAALDDDEYRLQTVTFENHEIAGISCRFDLPVVDAENVVELRVRAVARVARSDGDTVLRMSIYNPVDERFDTVVEMAPGDTTAKTLAFTTGSLRHVTRERQLRVTVVGEIAAGSPSEVLIDLVEVVMVARPTPP